MGSDFAAPAKPSASVLICRDGDAGLEVFMVKRHHQIDFASGALVFPGGKVEPGDGDPQVLAHAEGVEANDPLRAYKIAAIREAYEESGVLFARDKETGFPVSPNRLGSMEHNRDLLVRDEINILQFLEQEKLVLCGGELVHFAHWITPEILPKRFDTHFYLGHAPEHQIAVHDGGESVDSMWVRPSQLLADAEAGKATVIFPTRCNLMLLTQCHNVEEAIQRSRNRAIMPVLPWFEEDNGATCLCIPPEAGFPISREVLN